MSACAEPAVIIVGNAFEAVLEGPLSEIHREAEWKIQQAKIGEDLFAMDWREPLDGLEFYDEPSINQQIDLESVVYDNAIIPHGHGDLALDSAASLPKAFSHQGLVSTLKQSWAKVAMKMKPTIHSDPREVLDLEIARHLRVFV